eukprot:m.133209 g.133209  ORF g.133209 m.133209 type:complete len:297 (+) comp38116_c0_seq12:366-1256(+)
MSLSVRRKRQTLTWKILEIISRLESVSVVVPLQGEDAPVLTSTMESPSAVFAAWSSRLGTLEGSEKPSHLRPRFSEANDSQIAGRFFSMTKDSLDFLSSEGKFSLSGGRPSEQRSLHPILCNIPFLLFSGVELGSSCVKQCTLLNGSDQIAEMVLRVGKHFLVEIEGQEPASSVAVTAGAKECVDVKVWFVCDTKKLVQSSLTVSLSESVECCLPLSGYGGCSKIEPILDSTCRLEVEMTSEGNGTVTFELLNSGSRSGYVKIVWTGRIADAAVVHIAPAEFVIKPHTQMVIRQAQ